MSRRAWLAVAGSAAVVVLTVIVVVLASGGKPQPAAAPAADLASGPLTTSAPATTTTTTTATSTTTTTAKTTTTTKKPATKTTMPAPTPHPIEIPVPPPPHPAPVPGCAPSYTGENAPKSDVKAALLAAAGKQYWANATNPPMIESSTPPERAVITVPANLIQAVAWQESGWQSAIKACDGGVGTMQIMDATASWMNRRFGTSYDHTTLAGNTAIGAEYLEWLIAYFGENNFDHHYDITNQDLLTAVLVGYNAGPGAVQFADGHTVSSRYATTVKALMQSQPWAA